MKNWILYTFIIGFSAYWASNLLLWFPWSYSSILGITLMLTISPLLWTYATFLTLRTYPNSKLFKGAFIVSIIFLLSAVIMDYIFFGIIRNTMEDLYQPTTFYGYGFLLALPFILITAFRNKFQDIKRNLIKSDFSKSILIGFFCFCVLALIIILGIKI